MALPDISRLSRSLVIRHGLLITGTTLLSLALLVFLFFQSISYQIQQRAESALVERHTLADTLVKSEGAESLAEFIRIRETIPARQDLAFANFDVDGNRLNGNVIGVSCEPGKFYDVVLDIGDSNPGTLAHAVRPESASSVPRIFEGAHERFRFLATDNSNGCLLFGRSLQDLDTLSRQMRTMVVWALPICLLPSLVIGFLSSRRLYARVERISSAITSISQGRLDERLDVKGDDEIDRLSMKANGAFDKLEESVDALKQLSSMIAHDLKTPLSRLSMHLEEAIGSAQKGESNLAQLERAEASSIEMRETFDALLRIAQIESGRRRSGFTSIDLKKLINDMVEIYQPVCADAGMVLTHNAPVMDRPLIIIGDRELLQQLIANLLGNSLRYCALGTTLSIELNELYDHVQLSFFDNGPGIPEQERQKVFRRLYRVRGTKKSGSGLGLSLVKAVAELHNASVDLYDASPGLEVRLKFPKEFAA